MRQGGTNAWQNIAALDPRGSTVNYEPTNAERIARLQDGTKKGLCKLGVARAF